MGQPIAHHSTKQEIRFMRSLCARGRFNRLQMLRKYREAAQRRTEWGSIDAGVLLHATDREIETEIRKTNNKTA